MNPSPRPCTRLIKIPYLRVACSEVAYEYFANVSFVNAYKVLMYETACDIETANKEKFMLKKQETIGVATRIYVLNFILENECFLL